ncbi:MAG: phosphoribosylamine--glycine ligase [Bacteroidota bacterium]
MNILVLGSGGREHAFAWKIAQSEQCDNLYVAPGNAGTADIATNLAISPKDFKAVKAVIIDHEIDLMIVGPEEPLVLGIVDFFRADAECGDLLIVGPDKSGAILEGSKDFSKSFMQKHQVPTAAYQTFTADNIEAGYDFLASLKPPYVLKADGLAAGKGVVITSELAEAKSLLQEMLVDAKFGEASTRVVIEEFLDGIELSVFVLTDGKDFKILPEAKDYKRIGEGDQGLNTGGMGAVSPVPFADEAFMKKVTERIVIPTVDGLRNDQIDYRGFIFIGLMNVAGDPYVIEYNVRMGDPETEVVFPRIDSDLVPLLVAAANQTLNQEAFSIADSVCTTVVGVSGGYPEAYQKGKEITGLSEVDEGIIFHAGTKIDHDRVVTNGGRVIAFSALGDDLDEALLKSYRAVEAVNWDQKYFRPDIGKDLQNL